VGHYRVLPVVFVDMSDGRLTGVDVAAVDNHQVKATIIRFVFDDYGISRFRRIANRQELYFEIHDFSKFTPRVTARGCRDSGK